MHFTYTEPCSQELRQGDVLSKTPDLLALLTEVHPYYSRDNYSHLQVITQSCDLVRRTGRCKAPYITVVGVRPLHDVTEAWLKECRHGSQFEENGGVAEVSFRDEFIRFLERLYNNNEPDFFYLHEDPEYSFTRASCAYLRVSIAFRAQHYDRLLAAKVLELTDAFRAKLGWLVGAIYGRVATTDWVPTLFTEEEFRDHLAKIADSVTYWLENSRINRLRRKWHEGQCTPVAAKELIEAELSERAALSRKEAVVGAVMAVLTQEGCMKGQDLVRVRQLLYSQPEIGRL